MEDFHFPKLVEANKKAILGVYSLIEIQDEHCSPESLKAKPERQILVVYDTWLVFQPQFLGCHELLGLLQSFLVQFVVYLEWQYIHLQKSCYVCCRCGHMVYPKHQDEAIK